MLAAARGHGEGDGTAERGRACAGRGRWADVPMGRTGSGCATRARGECAARRGGRGGHTEVRGPSVWCAASVPAAAPGDDASSVTAPEEPAAARTMRHRRASAARRGIKGPGTPPVASSAKPVRSRAAVSPAGVRSRGSGSVQRWVARHGGAGWAAMSWRPGMRRTRRVRGRNHPGDAPGTRPTSDAPPGCERLTAQSVPLALPVVGSSLSGPASRMRDRAGPPPAIPRQETEVRSGPPPPPARETAAGSGTAPAPVRREPPRPVRQPPRYVGNG